MRSTASANARWAALARASAVLSQLVSVAVLSRLLNPTDYGVLALAYVVINLALLFRDLGTTAAIIQKSELSAHLLNSVFTVNLLTGLVLWIAVAAAGPVLARITGVHQLPDILPVLGLIFAINSLSIVHQAVLERESQFRTLALIEIFSTVTALALAVSLALSGFGIYSLVAQAVASALITSGSILLISPLRPRPVLRPQLAGVGVFGRDVTFFSLLVYLVRNADSLSVGRAFGAAALGVYSMGIKLMLLPLQNISGVATRVAFPVMSARQHAPHEVGIVFLRVLTLTSAISFPLMVGLWLVRDSVVSVLLGPHWTALSGLITWLAPSGLVQSIVSCVGPVFMALGRTRALLKLGLVTCLIFASAFAAGVLGTLEGFARYYLYANLLNGAMMFAAVIHLLGISFRRLTLAVIGPASASALMAAPISLLANSELPILLPSTAYLVLIATVGAMTYLLGLRVLRSTDYRELLTLVAPK